MARRKSDLAKALDTYRDKVRATKQAEEHGTHGDGRVAEALAAEKKARAAVLTVVRMDAETIRVGPPQGGYPFA